MKIKSFVLTLASLFAINTLFSQANILNAKAPEEIGVRTEAQIAIDNDKPLEYGYVDDRDIMFSKMTWEKVVLDERINFPLYYPVDTNNIGKDRRSLFDVLWKAVKEGEIEDVYSDSYFTTKRTIEDLKPAMSKVDTLDIGYQQYNADGYVDPEYILKYDISSYDISAYLIKGLWYFGISRPAIKGPRSLTRTITLFALIYSRYGESSLLAICAYNKYKDTR